jgi:hypothetical protein
MYNSEAQLLNPLHLLTWKNVVILAGACITVKEYLNLNTWKKGLRRRYADVVNGTDRTEVSDDHI